MHPRRYEILIMLAPNLPPEQLEAFQKKVDTIMNTGGGQVVRFEDWGRRRLSYPVKKEMYGHYLLYDFQGNPALSTELERNLKIDEKVFKYLTLVLSKKFTDEDLAEAREKLLAEAARREAEKARIREATEAAAAGAAVVAAEKAAAEAAVAAEEAATAEVTVAVEETATVAAEETATAEVAVAAGETATAEETGSDDHRSEEGLDANSGNDEK